MPVQYLFNSRGMWIAFQQWRHVYDERCNWIGWLPWGNHEVATQEGDYLGTIVDGNRFYCFEDRPRWSHPGNPTGPSYPAQPRDPGMAARAVLPLGATDVASLSKSRDQSSRPSARDGDVA